MAVSYQEPGWFTKHVFNPAGVFFGGVGPDSTDEELAAVASEHPVFRVEP